MHRFIDEWTNRLSSLMLLKMYMYTHTTHISLYLCTCTHTYIHYSMIMLKVFVKIYWSHHLMKCQLHTSGTLDIHVHVYTILGYTCTYHIMMYMCIQYMYLIRMYIYINTIIGYTCTLLPY